MPEIRIDKEKILNFFKGKYSEKDLNYISELFCDKTREEELIKFLKKHWFEMNNDKNEKDEKDLKQVLYKIHYDINTNDVKFSERRPLGNFYNWYTKIAAILFLPLILLLFSKFDNSRIEKNTSWVEVNAPAWTRVKFTLPDGSTGWLNSRSSIAYKQDFNKDRTLTLNGEAFLNVNRNTKAPFKVITSESVIEVLGTKFNVASYENENIVEVVLQEGKLVFNDKEMNQLYTLEPNDMLIFDKTIKSFSTEIVPPNKYLSWTEGKLVFRNDPLDVIARRLERWYNVDVEIVGACPQNLMLRATFVDESLEEIMKLLKRSLQIDYRIVEANVNSDEVYTRKKVTIIPKR